MDTRKVVLAYSGGLDTSVAIPWIKENYEAEVIALTIDLGEGKNLPEIRNKALKTGASAAFIVDGRDSFISDFVFPTLQAGAMYEGVYPLATALGRPLIAKHLVDVAVREGAYAVAHGSTGKGNDQVRFDVSIMVLAGSRKLEIIAPAREWDMNRETEREYARKRDIPVPEKKGRVFSVDENLWGRSIEGEDLENPWDEPPEDAFAWTKPVAQTPDSPLFIEVSFERGLPVALDGEELGGVALIQQLNRSGGEQGVGRIDHLENRHVGIKSREVYEAPAAVMLHTAHRALEAMVLTREQLRIKERLSQEYADIVYNGLWYSALRQDLNAYFQSTQRFVSGAIRLKLHKGNCTVVGRRSPYSLYSFGLATYGKGDSFDHRAAKGFINIFGLPVKNQAEKQPYQE
ncbi:MAG: argininosuccinate synthase [Chloroflexi bacterium]|nr:argininosuccinate synthase [Chloroflexota bacterium]